MALVEVMRLIVTQQIGPKAAGLLLYALQTASANLRRTSFEPELPTQVVIDRGCVGRRPIGATAWSATAVREYDDVAGPGGGDGSDGAGTRSLEKLGLLPASVDNLGQDDEGEESEEYRE